jgi:hypothetical protein
MNRTQISLSTIDTTWSAYRARPGRDSHVHARLVLAYAPIAKYLAARLRVHDRSGTVMTLPVALIALSRTIATWNGYHDGFLDHALVEVRAAVMDAIDRAGADS